MKSITYEIKERLARMLKSKTAPLDLIPAHGKAVDSYSQYGEDLVADAILGCRPTGVYVDIGANDPIFLNNTYRFYRMGWRGINIEPSRKAYTELVKHRLGDINLNIGVGDVCTDAVPFYDLSQNSLSSFDRDDAKRNCKLFGENILEVNSVNIRTLANVLTEHCASEIDLMSIDTEGYEMQVLNGNDWSMYRPKVIIIEMNNDPNKIHTSLKSKGYDLVWKNHLNGIFADKAGDNYE